MYGENCKWLKSIDVGRHANYMKKKTKKRVKKIKSECLLVFNVKYTECTTRYKKKLNKKTRMTWVLKLIHLEYLQSVEILFFGTCLRANTSK